MPCFSCKCFHEGVGRNGEDLPSGTGWCELHDQEYYRGHECSDYAPTWYGGGSDSSLNEPGGCFLSSACIKYKGLPDDCSELTELRRFRDTILGATEDGKALIKEYYRIAPAIVERIDKAKDKDTIYGEIYATIQKCLELIRAEKYDQAILQYKNMVYRLA